MKRTITFLLLAWLLTSYQATYAQWVEIPEIIKPSFQNNCVAYNGKVYFTGGPQTQYVFATTYNKQVDVLDLETGGITTLPQGISIGRCGMMCAAYEGKLYFAGGFKWVNNVAGILTYDVVDIYDVESGDWSTQNLSLSRGLGAVAVVDGKIMFAGGYHSNGTSALLSDVVDIYNPADSSWTVEHLSMGRAEFEVGVIGEKVWFCGGSTSWTAWQNTNRVDVYENGVWSIDSLSLPRQFATVATVDQYLLCAGGFTTTEGYSDRVDIFDTETNKWNTHTLSAPRFGMAAATLGNKVYFTGGGHIDLAASFFNKSTAKVDIFNAIDSTWTMGSLKKNRMTHSAAAWGNKIAVGGGWNAELNTTIGNVEILTDLSISGAPEPVFSHLAFSVFPNPATDFLTINCADIPNQTASILLRIFNHIGNEIWRFKMNSGNLNQPIHVDLSSFPNGTYCLKMEMDGQLFNAKPFSIAGK